MTTQKFRDLLFTNGTTKQTVARNAFWRFATAGFSKGVRFLAVILAARWLGPAEFGAYSYALAIGSIVFIFAEWGVNVLLTRDAQDPDEKVNELFSSALLFKAILTGIAFLVGVVLSLYIHSVSGFLVFLVVTTFALSNIRELFTSMMTAKHRNELETLTSVIEGLATVILIAALFYVQRTVTVFMTISLISMIVGLSVSVLLLFYKLRIRLVKVSLGSTRRFLVEGLPLALFGILSYLFFTADQLIIQHILGSEAVGYYSFATRIIFTLLLIPTLLTSVVFPVFAKKMAERQPVRALFQKVTLGLALLGGLCALFVFFARPLILFVAPQYTQSLPVLIVLSSLLIVMFVSLWLDYVLVAVRRQKQNFFITLCAALINVILDFIMIPRFGILGGAYATVISQCLNVGATYFYASYVLKNERLLQETPPTKVNPIIYE